MSARYRWGLVAACVLQIALLGWIVADRALLLANGREVRFAVVPVDPRDLFRGDYVVLSYPFSRVHNGRVAGDNDFAPQETVYVSLAEGVDGWEATALGREPPTEGLYLRGTIAGQAGISTEAGDDCPPIVGCTGYDIDYNLERFYVPEGTGREIESLRNDQRVSVDVAVAGDGQAALKRLLVDDAVRFEEGLY